MASKEGSVADEGDGSPTPSLDPWHGCIFCAMILKSEALSDVPAFGTLVNESEAIAPPILKMARQLLDMTQADLASAAGVSLRSLVDLEREVRRPMRATLARLRIGLEARGARFFTNRDGLGVYIARPRPRYEE